MIDDQIEHEKEGWPPPSSRVPEHVYVTNEKGWDKAGILPSIQCEFGLQSLWCGISEDSRKLLGPR